MYRLTEGEYWFIETVPMSKERQQLGWGEETIPSYVIKCWEPGLDLAHIRRIVDEADAVVIGSASDEWIRGRLKSDRLVFRYSERPLKNGVSIWKYFPQFVRWHIRNPGSKPIYMLCASGYTASDYALYGLFRNRCFKWGYFPKKKIYGEDIDMLINRKKPNTIIWVARFIDWKHPEMAVRLAERLKKDKLEFEMYLIGNGEMLPQITDIVKKVELEDRVQICGSMKPEQVREYMEKAQIHIFTSDRKEGWGAVLNESMNSGCAVVANRMIGSVPYLLKDGVNGFSYADGDFEDFYNKVKMLLTQEQLRVEFAKKAYQTIIEEWNAENAAKRLLVLTQAILDGENTMDLFSHGICSSANRQ